jgi:catechol 2,3-dioxygenase
MTTQPQINSALHAATKLGYVHLTVSDLKRSVVYYEQSIGLQVDTMEQNTAVLSAGKDPILALTELPGAQHFRRTTGLYHFAVLTPSRTALAKTIQNLIDTQTTIDGASDHLVSEALYLSDPDGNGIEIYRDRPRSEWPYVNGQLKMASDPLDIDGILSTHDGSVWTGLHPDTVLGHMHLHVSRLPEAVDFYRDVIGFELMVNWGGQAGFLAAGGYHHHLGVNTWAGVGAPPAPAGSVGLRYWTVRLAEAAERDRLIERLNASNTPFTEQDGAVIVRDPSQNEVRLIV